MPGPLQLFPRISDFYHRWYNDAFLNLQKRWSYAKLQFTWSIFLFRAWDTAGRGLFYKYCCQSNDRKIIYCQSCLSRVKKELKDQKSHFVWKMRQDLSSTIWQITAYLKWWLTWQIAMWAQESNSTNRQKAWFFSSKACLILNLNWAKKAFWGG